MAVSKKIKLQVVLQLLFSSLFWLLVKTATSQNFGEDNRQKEMLLCNIDFSLIKESAHNISNIMNKNKKEKNACSP